MRILNLLMVAVLSLVLAACMQGQKTDTTGAKGAADGRSAAQSAAAAWGNAPDFRFETFEGGGGSLSDFAGQPVVVNFWADWCPPCKQEMPMFEEVYRQREGEFILLGIAVSSKDPEAFVAQHGFSWSFAHDVDGARAYRIQAFPTTVFIDREGNVAQHYVGMFPDRETFEAVLNSIL